MSSPFPERLKAARLRAGLTQQGLADRLEVTKQAVSKYEQGKMLADSQVLIRLSKVLEVKPDYFFRPFRVSLGEVAFRKRESLSGRKLEGIKAEIAGRLERYLELEEYLGQRTPFQNPLAGRSIAAVEEVEAAAEKLLATWNLGTNPIPNVLGALEEVAIKVVEVETDGRFDGLSAWLDSSIPVIVLNQGFDLLRKRFTALHELGHLLLSFAPELSEKQREQACNRFAAALLLPRQAALAELGKKRQHISLQELIQIKESYGISVQATMYRAGDLGIISESTLQRFWKFRNSRPEYRLETGWGQYRGQESSGRYTQLLYHAVAEEIISMSKGAYLADMDLESFRKNVRLVV